AGMSGAHAGRDRGAGQRADPGDLGPPAAAAVDRPLAARSPPLEGEAALSLLTAGGHHSDPRSARAEGRADEIAAREAAHQHGARDRAPALEPGALTGAAAERRARAAVGGAHAPGIGGRTQHQSAAPARGQPAETETAAAGASFERSARERIAVAFAQ